MDITSSLPKNLLLNKHIDFLKSYSANKDGYEQIMVEYLRMSGMYWIITALDLMNCDANQGNLMWSNNLIN